MVKMINHVIQNKASQANPLLRAPRKPKGSASIGTVKDLIAWRTEHLIANVGDTGHYCQCLRAHLVGALELQVVVRLPKGDMVQLRDQTIVETDRAHEDPIPQPALVVGPRVQGGLVVHSSDVHTSMIKASFMGLHLLVLVANKADAKDHRQKKPLEAHMSPYAAIAPRVQVGWKKQH